MKGLIEKTPNFKIIVAIIIILAVYITLKVIGVLSVR